MTQVGKNGGRHFYHITDVRARVDTGAAAFIADANFLAKIIVCNPGVLVCVHTIDGGKYLPAQVTGINGSVGIQLPVVVVLCTHHKVCDGTVLYISVTLGDLNVKFIMPNRFIKKLKAVIDFGTNNITFLMNFGTEIFKMGYMRPEKSVSPINFPAAISPASSQLEDLQTFTSVLRKHFPKSLWLSCAQQTCRDLNETIEARIRAPLGRKPHPGSPLRDTSPTSVYITNSNSLGATGPDLIGQSLVLHLHAQPPGNGAVSFVDQPDPGGHNHTGCVPPPSDWESYLQLNGEAHADVEGQ